MYSEPTEKIILIPTQEWTLPELESVFKRRVMERNAKKETGPLFIGLASLRMEERSQTQDQKDLDIQRPSHLEPTTYSNAGNLLLPN